MFREHVVNLWRKHKLVFTKAFILFMKPWHVARRKHDVILEVVRIIKSFEHKPYQLCFNQIFREYMTVCIQRAAHSCFSELATGNSNHFQSRILCEAVSRKSGIVEVVLFVDLIVLTVVWSLCSSDKLN